MTGRLFLQGIQAGEPGAAIRGKIFKLPGSQRGEEHLRAFVEMPQKSEPFKFPCQLLGFQTHSRRWQGQPARGQDPSS